MEQIDFGTFNAGLNSFVSLTVLHWSVSAWACSLGLDGAAADEVGPARSGNWECPQCYFLHGQHSHLPSTASPGTRITELSSWMWQQFFLYLKLCSSSAFSVNYIVCFFTCAGVWFRILFSNVTTTHASTCCCCCCCCCFVFRISTSPWSKA